MRERTRVPPLPLFSPAVARERARCHHLALPIRDHPPLRHRPPFRALHIAFCAMRRDAMRLSEEFRSRLCFPPPFLPFGYTSASPPLLRVHLHLFHLFSGLLRASVSSTILFPSSSFRRFTLRRALGVYVSSRNLWHYLPSCCLLLLRSPLLPHSPFPYRYDMFFILDKLSDRLSWLLRDTIDIWCENVIFFLLYLLYLWSKYSVLILHHTLISFLLYWCINKYTESYTQIFILHFIWHDVHTYSISECVCSRNLWIRSRFPRVLQYNNSTILSNIYNRLTSENQLVAETFDIYMIIKVIASTSAFGSRRSFTLSINYSQTRAVTTT